MTQETIQGDIITNEMRRNPDFRIEEGERGGVQYRILQMPLDRYLARKIISQTEYRAADRLHCDFKLSGQTAGMTINLDPLRGSDSQFTEKQMEARERWRSAMLAINGHIGKLMILNVCCYGYYLNEVSYRYYNSSMQAMSRFREALDDLIKHYDLTRNS